MVASMEAGCIVCSLKIPHRMAFLIGINTLQWQCPHSGNYSTSNFKKSQWRIAWGVLVNFLLFCDIFVLAYEIYKLDMKRDKTLVMSKLSTILFLIGGISSTLSAVFQPHQRIKELNGLLKIIHYKTYYKIRSLYTKNDQNLVQLYENIACFLISAIVITAGYTKYKCAASINYSPEIDVFRVVVESIAVAIITCEGFFFLSSLWIYIAIFNRIALHIKRFLTQHLQSRHIEELRQLKSEYLPAFLLHKKIFTLHVENEMFCLENEGRVSLSIRICRIRRLYLSLILNIKEMNDYYNPTKIIHATIALFSLIVNNYIIIMGQIENTESVTIFSALSSVLGCAVVLLCAWKHADILMFNATKILPFLYSYPFSKLNYQDANQVEILMDTLHIRFPALYASGVYRIGTKLLASLSGTIVTYVLVALQFKIEWKDTNYI